MSYRPMAPEAYSQNRQAEAEARALGPRRAGVTADVYGVTQEGSPYLRELIEGARVRALIAESDAVAVARVHRAFRGLKSGPGHISKSDVKAAKKLAVDAKDEWLGLLEKTIDEPLRGVRRRIPSERSTVQVPEEYFGLGSERTPEPYSSRSDHPITYHPPQPGVHGPGASLEERIYQTAARVEDIERFGLYQDSPYKMIRQHTYTYPRSGGSLESLSPRYGLFGMDQREDVHMMRDQIERSKASTRAGAQDWVNRRLPFGMGER